MANKKVSDVEFPANGRAVKWQQWNTWTDDQSGVEFVSFSIRMTDRPVADYFRQEVAANYATGIQENTERYEVRRRSASGSPEPGHKDVIVEKITGQPAPNAKAAGKQGDDYNQVMYPMRTYAVAGPMSQLPDLERLVAAGKLTVKEEGMPYPRLGDPTHT